MIKKLLLSTLLLFSISCNGSVPEEYRDHEFDYVTIDDATVVLAREGEVKHTLILLYFIRFQDDTTKYGGEAHLEVGYDSTKTDHVYTITDPVLTKVKDYIAETDGDKEKVSKTIHESLPKFLDGREVKFKFNYLYIDHGTYVSEDESIVVQCPHMRITIRKWIEESTKTSKATK